VFIHNPVHYSWFQTNKFCVFYLRVLFADFLVQQVMSRMLPLCVLNVNFAALHNKFAGNSSHTVLK
jgi:hypothetical protein